jgi:predicted CoA-binding protein
VGEHLVEEAIAVVATAQAAAEFLTARRIAVTGVSRTPAGHGGNTVLQGLRARGFDVVPVNPNTDEIDGAPCYRSLADVPGPVDAVVVATRAELAEATMRECERLGIKQVWLHRSFGAGSVSQAAADYGTAHGIRVIAGGCPLMFGQTADTAHRFLKHLCRFTGAVPRQVA